MTIRILLLIRAFFSKARIIKPDRIKIKVENNGEVHSFYIIVWQTTILQ